MTDSQTPEVSVLMACHNASRWLQEAADSVLAQTFSSFEFILVDDGSTDDTAEIIERFRRRDQRVVSVAKEHSGLAHSLNVGIERARGKWIARLDADDLSEPHRLDAQLRFLRHHPDVVLLGSNFFLTDENGMNPRKVRCPSRHSALLWNLEHVQRFFAHSSAVFRRDLAQQTGSYNPWNRLSEDSDLWLRLAERGRIACIGDFLVRCRKHPQQISNTKAAGSPQLVYGIAAAVCHFLRIDDFPDPSRGTDEAAWYAFVAWIDRRVREEGIPEYHAAWGQARTAYLGSRNKIVGALSSGAKFVTSSSSVPLLKEKLFGLFLPRQLAKEWMTLGGQHP